MQYKLVVCGGTFDHFHAGHKAFLDFTLSQGEHVLLGLTSDSYVRQYKNDWQTIESYAQRKKMLEEFLQKRNAREKVTIGAIDTIFYPKEWERLPIDAIVVTKDTIQGAEMITNDRKQKGLPSLAVVVAPFVQAENGEVISSSHIRSGKISKEGIAYVKSHWFSSTLLLPQEQRRWFKKPFGTLFTHIDDAHLALESNKIITVGDVVTKEFNKKSIGQALSVVDFTVQRKKVYTDSTELGFSGNETILHAQNPPGHITQSLVRAVTKAFSTLSREKRIIILVDGEEDLAVLPLVLAAPLGYVIFYGQPHTGIVQLIVSSKTKDAAYQYLKRFVSSPH